MTDGGAIGAGQADIARIDAPGLEKMTGLATALAEGLLDAQIMNRPISDEHIHILARAAILLEEYAVELPPLVMQVLYDIERSRRCQEPQNGGAGSMMAKLMRPFRRDGK